MTFSALLLSAAALQAPAIIVTGARQSIPIDEAPLSATLFEQETIAALALPAAADLLRLAPGVSVGVSGPRGTQTQLRIRGAEATHTLLFVDGIRFNDPAAGNEARFELLSADVLLRIELVRGPQSALWGSEALGGVVAVEGPDPVRSGGLAASAEYGGLDSSRLYGRYGLKSGDAGIAAAGGWIRSEGIDSFGQGGERDGFDNVAASARAIYRPGAFELGAVGHWVAGRSAFDGFDPVTFRRSDTLDETQNRIGAVRGWASGRWGGWTAEAGGSYLDSANRNLLDGAPLNSTFGNRLTLAGQLTRRFGGHQLIAAIDHGRERFRARDTAFSGATRQDRSRDVTAVVGEWRARWTSWLVSDVAVRHDDFSAFADATTLRAAILVRPSPRWTAHAAYGEGIAQPSFYDLYGFFPGSFVGNPDLKPERSSGWEAGLRWRGGRFGLAVTGFSNRLRDEIVDVFDPTTFRSSTANAQGKSRRRGIEAEAHYWVAGQISLMFNYTLLDADEQQVAGGLPVREIRRPWHSANLVAHGSHGALSWGVGIAYVGRRSDTDFDVFPAAMVSLDDYLLGSLRLAYRILPGLEAYGRVENAFAADYQDVVGYTTPGRTLHAGLRVVLGR